MYFSSQMVYSLFLVCIWSLVFFQSLSQSEYCQRLPFPMNRWLPPGLQFSTRNICYSPLHAGWWYRWERGNQCLLSEEKGHNKNISNNRTIQSWMLHSITGTIYYNMGSAKLVTAAAVENKRTWSLPSGVL